MLEFHDAFVQWLAGGITQASAWQVVGITLLLTHVTIAAVTIYLHRCQAHRSLELHPIISHFFRFWLWLTTGMVTKQWAAIHRKHHAKCETEDDPHSPQTRGIKTVLTRGAELYRAESKNAETIQKYGTGTPDDWIERNLYTRHSGKGIILMLFVNVALFGVLGLTVWAVQMAWIPITAAGIINGLGHYRGYRNWDCPDSSTNLSPWGIIIGGEELHNNHHAFPTSAKLSAKPWEFDIGWLYIRTFEILGLARAKKTIPMPKLTAPKAVIDVDTLTALMSHRYDMLNAFAKHIRRERRAHGAGSDTVQRLAEMRAELAKLWERSTASSEQLVAQLQAWCQRAEASGVRALEELSLRVRCYA